MTTTVHVREFTDAACPFAFSAEPAIWRLRWLFGDALDWETRMVVLSESPEEYERRGLTPEKLSGGLRSLQERYGMPIDSTPRPRMMATVEAARAVVATRLNAPARERAILRAFRVRAMAGELIDEQATIDGAARDAGVDPHDLARWLADPAVEQALREDMKAARRPSSASLAQVHKLASTDDGGSRYTCPSLEFTGPDGRRIDAPGFQPVEVYESAIANLAPDLERRPAPESVRELLEWAGLPLATVEVAAVMGIDPADARTELARVASETPVGADGYWSLTESADQLAA
jgi:predicted DsbA family dithiol-disulfide isomerase